MQNSPVLATKSLPPGNGYNVPRVMRVEGGLNYIRGNSAPHFSLTYTAHRKGFPEQCYSGGAGHEFILQHFPRFADLAALHLSDIDGAPMHAEANGWYWLAGAMGGMGERHHGEGGPDKCLAAFASHCRIGLDEARRIAEAAKVATLPNAHGADVRCAKASHDKWREIMETMRPRWKAEAVACIERHKLVVFGDKWEGGVS